MRATWPAVAWFALAVFATVMLLRSLHPAGTLRPVRPAQWMLPRPAVAPQADAIVPALNRGANSTAGVQTDPIRTAPTAGTQLIKCVVHGQATYTNDPQECQGATQSGLMTAYPTRGVRPEAQ